MDVRKDCDKHDKDIKHLKEQTKEMQEDTFFLDAELQNCHKQNALLKAALQKSHTMCDEMMKQNERIKKGEFLRT